MSILLTIILCGQTPLISLSVPERPVEFARLVKMKVIIPSGDFNSYNVNWDVTELSLSESPLSDDLDVDSNGLKAIMPSGLNNTKVKVTVAVTFIYKDYSTRVAKETKIVTIGSGPSPIPIPDPIPTPTPTPTPVPVISKFNMSTWVKAKMSKTTLDKATSVKLASNFHSVAKRARYGEFRDDKQATITALAELNRPLATSQWISDFLQPLQVRLNIMQGQIETVIDQAQVFDEIGQALE